MTQSSERGLQSGAQMSVVLNITSVALGPVEDLDVQGIVGLPHEVYAKSDSDVVPVRYGDGDFVPAELRLPWKHV